MRRLGIAATILLSASPAVAQVRIEPRTPVQAQSGPPTPRTTWKDQLTGLSAETPKPPTMENEQSCEGTVILPDSIALIGGRGGIPPFDVWDAQSNSWAQFHDRPNAPDTVRARVVSADCAVHPIRIEARTATDYVAIYPGTLGLDGVMVVNRDGTLTPAVFRTDDGAQELHVEAMSGLALKHRSDPVLSAEEMRELRIKALRPRFRAAVRAHAVRIGMTDDEAELAWGTPETVNTTEYQGRYTEQWVYGNGRYLYLENGIVWAIQR